MKENEFQAALRSAVFGETAASLPGHDPRAIVMQLMRRDQRRTRWLAILSLLFWLLGAVGLAIMVFDLNELVILMRISSLPEQPSGIMIYRTQAIHHSLPWVGGGAVLALMVAALLTVLLIFSSRQATLNRINISLMEISEQLRARGATPPS